MVGYTALRENLKKNLEWVKSLQGWDILWKKNRGGRHWFWNGGLSHLLYTSIGTRGKLHAEPVYFLVFWGTFKNYPDLYWIFLLTCTLLDAFYLPSYGLESRKRYTLKLLLLYLGRTQEEGSKLFCMWSKGVALGRGLAEGLGGRRKLWYCSKYHQTHTKLFGLD